MARTPWPRARRAVRRVTSTDTDQEEPWADGRSPHSSRRTDRAGLAAFAGASSQGGGVITACKHARTGLVRIVSSAGQCRRAERVVRWNARGAGRDLAGPTGPAGTDGANGRCGSAGSIGPGTGRCSGSTRCERPRPRPGRSGGAQGPTGPKGDPGAGLSSFDGLDGLACTAGGQAERSTLTWDASRHAVFTCGTTGPPPPPPTGGVRVNEVMTGDTGAAADEFVELYNAGTTAGRDRRLEARLPLRGRHERRHARDDPGRHDAGGGRVLARRRERLLGSTGGGHLVLDRARRHGGSVGVRIRRTARSSTPSATARRPTRSSRRARPRPLRPRARASSGLPTATTRTPTPPTSRITGQPDAQGDERLIPLRGRAAAAARPRRADAAHQRVRRRVVRELRLVVASSSS